MALFPVHPHRPASSVLRIAGLAAALTAVFLLARSGDQRTATISDAVRDDLALPTATVFAQPSSVSWEGVVTRTFAGGQGIEVRSPQVQGGYFVAYADGGIPASASTGSVLVQGRWTGISCEYGRCMPEVESESVQPLPIEPE